MAKKRRQYDDDDGRVIANMNVEGMPWHRPDPAGAKGKAPGSGEMLSRRETVMVMLSAMKWAFLFAITFSALMVLFIIFCVKVWFRG